MVRWMNGWLLVERELEDQTGGRETSEASRATVQVRESGT